MQDSLNLIANWTEDNLMKLKEQKSNYMVFSRGETKYLGVGSQKTSSGPKIPSSFCY